MLFLRPIALSYIVLQLRVKSRDLSGDVLMLRRTMRCSFCQRSDSEVAKLVAGPWRMFAGRVYICDRCAAETIRIMNAHAGEDQPRGENS
jgi:hypothetical protein